MNDLELFESFFQESNSYYLEKLELFEKGKRYSINYSALIFGVFWFLYRKLYKESLLIFLIIFLRTIFENFILNKFFDVENIKVFGFLFNILLLIFLGFIANSLYIKKAKKVIENIKKNNENIDLQKNILVKKGGTNIIAPIILLAIIILTSALN